MAVKVRPLHDRIIVERIEEGEQQVGGIIIPDTAKEKPQQGKVIAAGNGKVKDDGSVTPLDVVAERPVTGCCSACELESMSSTIRSARVAISACASSSRFTALNPTRFSSWVSSSVSNQCNVDVSAAPRSQRFGDPIRKRRVRRHATSFSSCGKTTFSVSSTATNKTYDVFQ